MGCPEAVITPANTGIKLRINTAKSSMTLLVSTMHSTMGLMMMLLIKTVLGEKYYSCVTSYPKTFSAIAILVGAAVVNWLVSAVLLKYVLNIALFALLAVIYWKEARYLFSFGTGLIREFFKGRKR